MVKLASRVDPNFDCGDGTFALEDIPKGQVVTRYGGLFITEKQALAMPVAERSHMRRLLKGYLLDGRTMYQSGSYRGLGAYVNESRDKEVNAEYIESKGTPTTVEVRTKAALAAGTELLVSYGRDYDDSHVLPKKKVGRPRKTTPVALRSSTKALLAMNKTLFHTQRVTRSSQFKK